MVYNFFKVIKNVFLSVSKAALVVPGAAAAGAEGVRQRRRSFCSDVEDFSAALYKGSEEQKM